MMDDLMNLKPPRRLRAGSGRQRRLLRLVWLAGWRVADMAALTGECERTVRRRLADLDLMQDEAPGEMARLLVAVQQDCVADALASSGEMKEAVATHQKLAATARVMQAAEKEHQGKDSEQTDEDWRERALEELERMVSVDPGLETKAAAGGAGEAHKTPQQADENHAGRSRVSDVTPGYTGAAAGPEAHMVAFGGAWRGQDAGRGRMGPLGGAAGGLSPGGAGGAELSGRP